MECDLTPDHVTDVRGDPGTRRRGSSFEHFIWKYRDRWRTGTHQNDVNTGQRHWEH